MMKPTSLVLVFLFFLSLTFFSVQGKWVVQEIYGAEGCEQGDLEQVIVVSLDSCFSFGGSFAKTVQAENGSIVLYDCTESDCTNCTSMVSPVKECTPSFDEGSSVPEDSYYVAYVSNTFPYVYEGLTAVHYTEPNCKGVVGAVEIEIQSPYNSLDCPLSSITTCDTSEFMNSLDFCEVPSFLINSTSVPTAFPSLPTRPPLSTSGFNPSSPFIIVNMYDFANCTSLEIVSVYQMGSCVNLGVMSAYYAYDSNGDVNSYTCSDLECGECRTGFLLTSQCQDTSSETYESAISYNFSSSFPSYLASGKSIMVEYESEECKGKVLSITFTDYASTCKEMCTEENYGIFCSVDSMMSSLVVPTPAPTSTPTPSKEGLTGGAIAAIVIVVLVVVGGIIGYFVWRQKRGTHGQSYFDQTKK